MLMRRIAFLAVLLCAAVSCADRSEAPAPMAVIFDTDMGNDIDDALALDMLYKYADEGRIDLLAIPVNKEGLAAPEEIIPSLSTCTGKCFPRLRMAR